MSATATAIRTIEVALSANPYPVVIGRGALSSLGQQILGRGLKAGTKVLIVTNPVVHQHYGAQALGSLQAAGFCLLYTSPSPRDVEESRMPSSA